MGTILFIAFVAAMLTAGFLFWRKRVVEIEEATREREHARAISMGLVAGMTPPVAEPPEPIRLLVPKAVAAVPVPAAPAAAVAPLAPAASIAPVAVPAPVTPLASVEPPPAAPAAPIPPPDERLLRRIKRNRFARVGLAYFEAAGFRVKQNRGESPIDTLLFAGDSKIPLMSVRWSRVDGGVAPGEEIAAFADATRDLKLARGTFISQHGAAADAIRIAGERGIVLIDAAQLAAKLAALEPSHHARLTAIALGEVK
ncbi:hypothetical protein BH09PSE6_BH09PSE6_05630 [soil metagenome]